MTEEDISEFVRDEFSGIVLGMTSQGIGKFAEECPNIFDEVSSYIFSDYKAWQYYIEEIGHNNVKQEEHLNYNLDTLENKVSKVGIARLTREEKVYVLSNPEAFDRVTYTMYQGCESETYRRAILEGCANILAEKTPKFFARLAYDILTNESTCEKHLQDLQEDSFQLEEIFPDYTPEKIIARFKESGIMGMELDEVAYLLSNSEALDTFRDLFYSHPKDLLARGLMTAEEMLHLEKMAEQIKINVRDEIKKINEYYDGRGK